jgi:hypothetical protein
MGRWLMAAVLVSALVFGGASTVYASGSAHGQGAGKLAGGKKGGKHKHHKHHRKGGKGKGAGA